MRVLVPIFALIAGCVSAPASTPTQATDARNHDPWLDGAVPCPAGANDDLKTEDLAVGDGRPILPGDTVRIHYSAAEAATAKKLHDSRSDGPPLELVLGSTKTVCGLDRSLVGMHAGGQRRVLVPAALAFGSAGRPPDIAPNTDLLFTIDVFVVPELTTPQSGSPPPNPGGRGGGGRRR